jgi:hypothetical protein
MDCKWINAWPRQKKRKIGLERSGLSAITWAENGKLKREGRGWVWGTEQVFLNFYGAQESIPRNRLRHPM